MLPDLDGFRDAQVRLIDATAESVVFFTPEPTVYPSGAMLDPQSGEPFDPTVEPESSGWASAAVPCNVVTKPIQDLEGERTETQFGTLRENEIAAFFNLVHLPFASGATEAEHLGVRYTINDLKPDGLQTRERYIAFMEEKGI